MRFHLRCLACGAMCWADGWTEYDTNSWGVNDNAEMDWQPLGECEHEEYEATDSEYDDGPD